MIWKEYYGSIPKGHNIQFKDGNRKNCTIENLYIIDRRKQMLENSGTVNLPDRMIALYIAGHRGKNKHLVPAILENNGLIEMKRQQLLLNREIKNKNEKRKSRRKGQANGR